MGYPSYVKMIGMTESKRLLLRKTLALNSVSSQGGGDLKTNAFQIVLNPLECPNIKKVFTNVTFNVTTFKEGTEPKQTETKPEEYTNLFKYDYLRIKSIFISIKPAQNVSTSSGINDQINSLYDSNGDSPISNVYAYFTYRYPMLSPNDINATIENMYGTNPNIDRIIKEGQLKNTYSWPSNKSMTISINKLMYRVNTDPYRIYPNAPFDLQFLGSLCNKSTGIYDPFQFKEEKDYVNHKMEKDNSFEEIENQSEDYNQLGAVYNGGIYGEDHQISVPDLQQVDYNLFFGRLVIVSPKQLRFTAEICYDCVLLR